MDNVYDLKMQLNCQNESQIYTRNFCIKMKIKYMNGWAGGIWSWIILSMVFPRQSLSHLTTSFLSLPSPCCTNYSRSPSSIPFHLPSQISCSLIDDNKWCKCAFHWQASPSRYILHVCPLLIHCNINTTTITHTNSDFRDILQCVLIRLTGLSIKKLLPTASASTATWEF